MTGECVAERIQIAGRLETIFEIYYSGETSSHYRSSLETYSNSSGVKNLLVHLNPRISTCTCTYVVTLCRGTDIAVMLGRTPVAIGSHWLK